MFKFNQSVECDCGYSLSLAEAHNNFYICPKCKKYLRMPVSEWINTITDSSSFKELPSTATASDFLELPDYKKKLLEASEKTGMSDAIITGTCKIDGKCVGIGIMNADFMLGSMGSVVGSKIASLFLDTNVKYVVLVCASSGARMQEGIISLLQMGKIVVSMQSKKSNSKKVITILTSPTMGGVTASFASLGDIILAEPNAMIGFTGPRVIKQTIGEELPEGFQTAESQLKNGFIDAIVERQNLKRTISKILNSWSMTSHMMPIVPTKLVMKPVTSTLSSWEKLKLIRNPDRLDSKDYIDSVFDDFFEIHGDRCLGDDPTIIGGLATFNELPVTVIGITKGHNPEDLIKNKFGMPSPEGYRKATRIINMSPDRPIIIFVNTMGAYPGVSAEMHGQGVAIAECLSAMATSHAPILTIITGEGGSGGALALSLSNEVWMLENAVYSVTSPEAFSSILWKDSSRAEEAAGIMKMSAKDVLDIGFADGIISECGGATKENLQAISEEIKKVIYNFIRNYYGTISACAGRRIIKFNKF